MAGTSSRTSATTDRLLGRRGEREALDRLLDGAREERGAVLVLHGEAGVGKTRLLEYAAEAAEDFRTVRISGVEGEMELPFAAVQQLVAPFAELTEHLPGPQREALDVAFGVSGGPPPDRFLVGLATLGVLSEAAEEQPLLALVDDAQWLDDSSAQALAFVARRLAAERIVLLFASRRPGDLFDGLPQLEVGPLARADSRALLESALPTRLDEHVLDRIVLETRGNPLALLELPRGLTPIQLAGGFGLPATKTMPANIEESFTRRLAALPDDARRFLLLAAADSVGDPALLWRAAQELGIAESAVDSLETVGLLEVGPRVVFRHPLVRSAVYGRAGTEERSAIHRALARATDPQIDPDRRAWHLGQATSMPDEDVAAELERSAGRAQARGGLAAGAAFLARAADLTPEARRRSQRLLAAAGAKRNAGDLDGALGLLAGLDQGALDELGGGRARLLEAQIALEQRRAVDAGRLFLGAATRLQEIDPLLARDAFLEALGGALTNDVAVDGGPLVVAAAARAAPPPPGEEGCVEVLLHAYANRLLDGYASAAPLYARALGTVLASDPPGDDVGRWLSLSSARDRNVLSLELWDEEALHVLAARQVQLARDAGALGHLEFALSFLARSHIAAGELAAAATLLDEAARVAEATGNSKLVNAPVVLAAWRGEEPEAAGLIDANSAAAIRRRWTSNDYARAVLYNGLGRYEEARDAAWEAMRPDPIGYGTFLIPELAEAASRTGDGDLLDYAVGWLGERTDVIESPWAEGIAARVRALASEGDEAEGLHRRSIEHLSGTRLRLELARSRLLYGEWLRRERRRVDAREQLRAAFEAFDDMGARAFAGRAERELMATWERARRRTVETIDDLTPQEAQIARLAAGETTNREIAAQLFISPSTVEYHLRKVFRKLDVRSRTQLAGRLEERGGGATKSPGSGDDKSPASV
ncbi:MAG TPA: AAA family ATPase [Solirubrobacterales bacterium]|nr:AAA family ATPase [Solirubrobacterales bacterium]